MYLTKLKESVDLTNPGFESLLENINIRIHVCLDALFF